MQVDMRADGPHRSRRAALGLLDRELADRDLTRHLAVAVADLLEGAVTA